MTPIWAEAATRSDIGEMSEYLHSTKQNLHDALALSYPATQLFKAAEGGRNLVFMPIQKCQVWESLGINPQASEMEIAASLKALAQVLRFKALADGEGEIYFLCAEESTQKFAERNGFERINTPVFRMRIR